MYTTFQNIGSTSIDFDSLVGKYLCFLNKGPEDLTMTVGKYVTNCNYIYKVIRTTNSFMIVESDFHGQITDTKLRKDSFEKEFFDCHYVICDDKPVPNVEVGTYTIKLPDYKFNPTSDLTKSFTTDEINELLVQEFLGSTKTSLDVRNCFETLCNIIMKRHFDYINIGRSYFQSGYDYHVGLDIKTGYKYLSHFGNLEVKTYRNKITSVQFQPFDWINSYVGFKDFVWTDLESLIVKYLTDNKDYIDTLK